MITALLLIFDPSNTWERIGQTTRHSVSRVFLSYLLPIVLLANVVEAIGIDQSGNQVKRQIIAIDGMGRKQRPAWLYLDGPETVELDGGLRALGKRRARKLRGDVKAERRARMP